jgi:hypothetical protein
MKMQFSLQNSSQHYKSITLPKKEHETPPEHEFLNFLGAQKPILRNQFRQSM